MKSGVMRTSFRNFVQYVIGAFLVLMIASCGGGGGSPGTVAGSTGTSATTPASVSLLFSSPELPSSGAASSEVTVTALVKNASNNAVASVPVTFAADSGALTSVATTTDANGKATASLGTSGDRTNRTITVTVRAGNITATGTVNVVGTTVSIIGPNTVTSGGTGEFSISVRDQAGVAVAGVPVTISSSRGNPIAIKTSGGGSSTAPLTNSQGQVVITVTGSQAGSDTLTASAQGSSFTYGFNVNAVQLLVSTSATQANVQACTSIFARYENAGVGQNGTINISASRGTIYSDSACTTPLGSSSVPVTSGNAQTTFIASTTVGITTITATVVNGPTAQTNLEFVAPLTSSATISLAADPAVISTSGTGQTSSSELTVVVRDGTTQNNLVKDAVVEFAIVNDQSGGALSSPSVVTTDRNGTAKVTFNAGVATTPANGVTIQAKIQGTTKTATTTLTVSRKSLFITAGTGNLLEAPTSTTYKQDYSVFVTDASGNPVSDVTVTASIVPMYYRKGSYEFDDNPLTTESGWIIPDSHYVCPNEDLAPRNGILDAGEDANNNGRLDPGIPLNVTSSGRTDVSGTAIVSILYPKDRGNWTDVQLTIRGFVVGTESFYTTAIYTLPVLASDLSNSAVHPPGFISPYGTNPCNVAN